MNAMRKTRISWSRL